MEKEQLETKFNSLASSIFDGRKCSLLLDAFYNLEVFDDFAEFMKLTV